LVYLVDMEKRRFLFGFASCVALAFIPGPYFCGVVEDVVEYVRDYGESSRVVEDSHDVVREEIAGTRMVSGVTTMPAYYLDEPRE